MKMALLKSVVSCLAVALFGGASLLAAAAAPADFDGVWIPDVKDQHRQEIENIPPWKPEIVPQIQHLTAEEKAGRPFLVLSHCLPHGMPSWMLISHNAFEWLTTPGRITFLGEVDGNRMRRIYTDGRAAPEDPDLTLHGYSIGHWAGDTLVVDTTAIVPQAYIATSEAVGIPNNGDMHIVERLYLAKPNELHDDLEVNPQRAQRALEDHAYLQALSGSPLRDCRRRVRTGRSRSRQGSIRQRHLRLASAKAGWVGQHQIGTTKQG